jgi:hypothetical protein
MPKRMLSHKQPKPDKISKEPRSTLQPSLVGHVSNSLKIPESTTYIMENPTIQTQELPNSSDYTKFLPEILLNIKCSVIKNIEGLLKYYQVSDHIPTHTLAKIETILSASNIDEAALFASKANESAFMYCLAQWAQGNAAGPRTKKYIEHQARKEEGLAKRLEAKGYLAAAARHKEKALSLWTELHS